MITKIGITGGEIWPHLEKFKNISFVQLVESLEKPERPKDLLLMSLGWLIYEGHVRWTAGKYGGMLSLATFREESQK